MGLLMAAEDLESIRGPSLEDEDEEATARSDLSGGESWTRLPAGSWRLPSVLLGGIGSVSSGRIGSWRIPSVTSAVQVAAEEEQAGSGEPSSASAIRAMPAPMVMMDPIVAHALRQAANIMQVWRCGGVEAWRCGGVEVWRCGGVSASL